MIFASHQLLENPSFLQLLVFTVYLVRRISPFYFLIQILDTSGNMFLDKEINAKGKSSGLGYISVQERNYLYARYACAYLKKSRVKK